MTKFTSSLYKGHVVHQRIKPKRHRLRYGVFSLLIDLDELTMLSQSLKLFSYNNWSIFSILDKDHGNSLGIRSWVESALEEATIYDSSVRIMMLSYPRILGYVFNPITTYFCYKSDNTLGAIIYEVHNTFKERHYYILRVSTNSKKIIKQSCKKKFYVSPFVDMDCTYHFRILPPSDQIRVVIREEDSDGLLLAAAFYGQQNPINDLELLKVIFHYPLMTIKVIMGIHFEALKLFFKRVPFFRHTPQRH